jgi:hypothetical protein
MIVLVTGGRDFNDAARVERSLEQILAHARGDLCIVQGAARGADALARAWAKRRGVACADFPAHWDALGNAAGTLRNTWMLMYMKVDYVLAFPGGNGTAHMKRVAHAHGVPVYEG